MADAVGVAQDGDAALGLDPRDEFLGAPGHDEVDPFVEAGGAGPRPPAYCRDASQSAGIPAPMPAGAMSSHKAALVRAASLPPFRMRALPLLAARQAIWTRASGLDSKIIATRPMGQLTCLSTSPSSRRRAESTRPAGSGRRLRASIPATESAILDSSKRSRLRRGFARPAASAAARSAALAATIPAAPARRASAMEARARSLLAPSRARQASAARLPRSAFSLVVMERTVSD